MLTCHDVARYFLTLMSEENGDLISNLKLQKLLYYAQGSSLALWGNPLFSEKIEAWLHGPVIPSLYYEYEQYNSKAIPRPQDVNFDCYEDDVQALLNEVYSVFGQYSAWKLANMVHEEPPWQEVYESQPGGIISLYSMKKYFEAHIVQ
ncbi:MAG: type II toxin-antitoxin system antitoxin SocA domain-containing protein [Candidatus Parabeggiatoa sp.]|nr:type II toxin-antitoxin system antitoxin SocA domain-containing protein [Candidatus Parabeggiatoa sp.]